MAKGNNIYKPGMKVPKSGQYAVFGPKGGNTNLEVTCVENTIFPPTQKQGNYYKLTDPTKHKK